MQKQMVTKHKLATRWFHWLNFPLLAIMIWSGVLIYWANDVYEINVFGVILFKFFPETVYNWLNAQYRLADGMAWHFAFMWLFTINGVLYVLYTLVSGEWRDLVPNRHSFREAWLVLLHDLRIRRDKPVQKKYNGAQRIAYSAIILMGFGSIVTGLAIYKPVQLGWLTWLCGGYTLARLLHFALTVGYVLFFTIHIVQVVMAGWNNFRGMVAGFEVVAGPPAREVDQPENCPSQTNG
jgi:thiosulfate reductase cytochrome b subunit